MDRYGCFQDRRLLSPQLTADIVLLRTLYLDFLFMAASSPSSLSSADVVNSPGSVLSYKNLSYSIKTKAGQKQLIDDVSVDIRAGELLAIMVCRTIHIPQFSLIIIPRDHLERVRGSPIQFSVFAVNVY